MDSTMRELKAARDEIAATHRALDAAGAPGHFDRSPAGRIEAWMEKLREIGAAT